MKYRLASIAALLLMAAPLASGPSFSAWRRR